MNKTVGTVIRSILVNLTLMPVLNLTPFSPWEKIFMGAMLFLTLETYFGMWRAGE